jgi:hypothetical protein
LALINPICKWDTPPNVRGIPHGERILANDPDGVFFTFTL